MTSKLYDVLDRVNYGERQTLHNPPRVLPATSEIELVAFHPPTASLKAIRFPSHIMGREQTIPSHRT